MSDRTYTIFITLIGAVCGYVVIKRVLSADSLILRNALIQGFFVGFGLAVVTIEIFGNCSTGLKHRSAGEDCMDCLIGI
jgi:hypothetical protein